MQTLTRIAELRQAVIEQRRLGKSIGLVPTMGNLHDGHLELVRSARRECDWVITSIFVNPLQFGANEDLEAYPRTLADDAALLKSCQCDALFHPDVAEVYPQGLRQQTRVSVPELGNDHCGRSRPGHFDGVTTVVAKLFNLCQPDQAFFGLKDYQQYLIVRRMVEDLCFPVRVHGVETRREADGLAMSSRNGFLTSQERKQAPYLYSSLRKTALRIEAGERDYPVLEAQALETLAANGLRPDYFRVCQADTLRPAATTDRELVILAAAFLGKTRIIDNIRQTLP